MFSCEFCKISKNTFIYRTPLVAASGVLNSQGNSQESCHRSSQAEVFVVKGVLKICSRFTGEHSCWSVISITLQSTHWNHTLVWLFFSKFAAYFQNTFLWEHLWSAASAVNYFAKKTTLSMFDRVQNIPLSSTQVINKCSFEPMCLETCYAGLPQLLLFLHSEAATRSVL